MADSMKMMTVLNLAELDRLAREVAKEPLHGKYTLADANLATAVYHQLRPLLELVHRMGRVLEAGCGARVPPPVTNTPTCFFCGRLCLIQHKCVTIDVGDGRFIYFHNAHEEDCWTQEKETRAALDAYREVKEGASQ